MGKSKKELPGGKTNGVVLKVGKSAIDTNLAKLFDTSLKKSHETKAKTQTVGGIKSSENGTPKKAKTGSKGSEAAEDDSDDDEEEAAVPYDEYEIIYGTGSRIRTPAVQKILDERGIQTGTSSKQVGEDVVVASESVEGMDVDASEPTNEAHGKRSRKRKDRDEDDIEGRYMKKLEKEEEKDDAAREAERKAKRAKTDKENGFVDEGEDEERADSDDAEGDGDATSDSDSSSPPPQHESLAISTTESSVEKASRTVFLANVSTSAIKSKSSKRTLLDHLASFIPDLPATKTAPHAVESLRFRSTAYAASDVPKKAAFARKELMDATTKSTNAYAVYTTALAAREACKRLNGTIVLDRHLRVDSVAHPAKQDHRRCVFVGNLGFVDDESMIQAAQQAEKDEENPRKQKSRAPGDVEEGLWRQFGTAGEVESVRVVRDKTTRVGKGFAYVQFRDANAVEKALLFNDQKYPPMLPRKLRVTRAKNPAKTASALAAQNPRGQASGPHRGKEEGRYVAKPSSQSQSLAGRAGKLLGRAGAAQVKRGKLNVSSDRRERRRISDGAGGDRGDRQEQRQALGVGKLPEEVVFEGYRAKQGNNGGMKMSGGSGKSKQGKPRTRSSKRGAAFKAGGGKKR